MVAGALALWDCATSVINVLAGDPLGLCATVASFGIADLPVVAAGILAIAILVIVLTWLPVIRARRRRVKAAPERALIENIGRLGEPYRDWKEVGHSEPGNIDLVLRVEVIESAFGAGSPASRDLTTEWISLLQESNRRHNSGELATDDFKVLNTRLLDVVSRAPRPQPAPAQRG
jgi:hypothetical protein